MIRNRKLGFFLLAIVLILYYTEICIENLLIEIHEQNGAILRPLVTTGIFCCIISYCKPVSRIGTGLTLRKLSTILYLSHPVIMAVGYKLFGFEGFERVLFVIIVFIPFFLIYQLLEKRKGFKWLSYGY